MHSEWYVIPLRILPADCLVWLCRDRHDTMSFLVCISMFLARKKSADTMLAFCAGSCRSVRSDKLEVLGSLQQRFCECGH
jgi:hypothetical protein